VTLRATDIIFFIYLYQRWIYPVDKTRRNEFGTSAIDQESVTAANEALKSVQRVAGVVKSRRGKRER
jgi:hypothetical protein